QGAQSAHALFHRAGRARGVRARHGRLFLVSASTALCPGQHESAAAHERSRGRGGRDRGADKTCRRSRPPGPDPRSSGPRFGARADYQEALREEPANRDALLGLAAIDVRAGRYEPAEAIYLRLLQSDPRDSHAHAALIELRAGRMDPLAAESRVKSLLANDPSADVLHFTLGNQLALQGRWAEAQQH